MRVIFFPSYQGGGFGHIGRCLAVAQASRTRGAEVLFALDGPHRERLAADWPVIPLTQPPYRPATSSPTFTVVSGFAYQLLRDGLTSAAAVRAAVREGLDVIARTRPDVLVGDAAPLVGLLGHLTGVPVVQIVRAGLHPAGPGLIWWSAPPAALIPPDPRPLFNPLLARWRFPPLQRAEDLLTGTWTLIPSLPELDPLPPHLPRTTWVGPLVRDAVAELPPELAAWLADGAGVYVTLGGGAVGGLEGYRALLAAANALPFRTLIATGTRLAPDDLPAPGPQVRLEAWVPGPQVIARSRLVVFAGGYGTSMEAAAAGTPGLVIPFHSEQESNARRLAALGLARLLLPYRGAPVIERRRWGGEFTTLTYPAWGLSAAALGEAITSAWEDAALHTAAADFATNLAAAPCGGAAQAAAVVAQVAAEPSGRALDQLDWWQRLRLRLPM
jgi:UDP:flavonoid glycosyltransferase YjiC (YdhE family)